MTRQPHVELAFLAPLAVVGGAGDNHHRPLHRTARCTLLKLMHGFLPPFRHELGTGVGLIFRDNQQ